MAVPSFAAATGPDLELESATVAEARAVWAAERLKRLLNDDILADDVCQRQVSWLALTRGLVRIGVDVSGMPVTMLSAGQELLAELALRWWIERIEAAPALLLDVDGVADVSQDAVSWCG